MDSDNNCDANSNFQVNKRGNNENSINDDLSDDDDDEGDNNEDSISGHSFDDNENDNNEDSINGDLSDENDDNEGDNNNEPEHEPPLYPSARLTLSESMVAILIFYLRHSLSGVALVDLLELIELHCLVPNVCKSSLYLFKQHFEHIETPLVRHFYCSNCFRPLENSVSSCEECPVSEKEVSYFIQIPIVDQLQKLYRRKDFVIGLNSRFNRVKKNVLNYEDIYDGNIYKQLRQPGNKLWNNNNISFMWNSDGVSLYKSSNYQIWPFYLSVNELPYDMRTKKENMILVGLWFGSKKPCPAVYLDAISDELNLISNGIEVEVPCIERTIEIAGHVIGGTCDLPAKAIFLNMKQFNSSYGCHKCKIFVMHVSKVPIYLYQDHLQLRTQNETNEFARTAVHLEEDNVFGVKGLSVISRFSSDYIRSTAVDVLHCVYLGVVKALLKLWFSKKYKHNNWSFFHHIHVVDRLLCAITPPSSVSRLPRSISEHQTYWKGHEFKNWLFYYSLPILRRIMGEKPAYFIHYKLLVDALSLVHQSSISEQSVNVAHDKFCQFVEEFEDLYEMRHLSANIHQLLHIAQNVRDFGPIYLTSCDVYESLNGDLANLVTGTRFAGLQISAGLSYIIGVNLLLEEIEADSIIYNYCCRLKRAKRKYKSHQISSKIFIVGGIKQHNNVPVNIENELLLLEERGTNVQIFARIIKSNQLYTSELYTRHIKTNSSYIKFTKNDEIGFGSINCFLKISNCKCNSFCQAACNATYYAVVKKCRFSVRFNIPEITLDRIYRCSLTDEIIIISLDDIINVCFYIKFKNEQKNYKYIVEPINSIEIE